MQSMFRQISSSRRIAAALSWVVLFSAQAAAQQSEKPDPAAVYRVVSERLAPIVQSELVDKGIPAFSIALVVDQDIVWARGFGYADPEKTQRATAGTVYRVGSVSKLFNAIAVMQLVERGKLELDAPLQRYLSDFKIDDPKATPITLRQLLSHRAGIVRESPVGSYFDADEPSLAETVASLRTTPRIYPAESKTKYSNAGVSVAGYVVEKVAGEPFSEYVEREILQRMGMRMSSFALSDELRSGLAAAEMWTYDARRFPAPVFRFGILPAGNLYSTVGDLGRFISVLFREGKVPGGRVLSVDSLREMYEPQLNPTDSKRGFGLGFYVSEFEGQRRVGHSGAVYGFSTQLAALPEAKLGVAAVASLDVTNGAVSRISDYALRCLLAHQQGKDLPDWERRGHVSDAQARAMAGVYRSEAGEFVELVREDGRLMCLRRSLRAPVKVADGATAGRFVLDGRIHSGTPLRWEDAVLSFGETEFRRVKSRLPGKHPADWHNLIGEYGWDHNTLYVYEKRGRLHALIEWFFDYPLRAVANDDPRRSVFHFPSFGLYHGERLVFEKDEAGQVVAVIAASVRFPRRALRGVDETFTIEALLPPAELRRVALAASPPAEPGEFKEPDLVDLTRMASNFRFDIRYAGRNNFLQTVFYESAKAFLQRPAAEALQRVQKRLEKDGYGLLIFDAYRPWFVTKMFWEATPESMRDFVADPSKGSRHNRGAAVDLTLYDLKTGKPVTMVSGYDEFTTRSYPSYPGGTHRQRWHRERLRQAMEAEGFEVYPFEWWHFDYKDWREYPILNKTFAELGVE